MVGRTIIRIPMGVWQNYFAKDFEGGKQVFRVDFQGKPHMDVLPHVHVYLYNKEGKPNGEYIFDIFGNLIEAKGAAKQ